MTLIEILGTLYIGFCLGFFFFLFVFYRPLRKILEGAMEGWNEALTLMSEILEDKDIKEVLDKRNK